MKLCIVSLKKFCFRDGTYWTYGGFADYVMSFLPYVDELLLCVPVSEEPLPGMYPVSHPNLRIQVLPFYRNELQLLFKWPTIFWKLRTAIREADIVNPRIPDMTGVAGWLWARWYKKPHFVSIQSDMHAFLEAPGSTRTRGIVRWGLFLWIRFYLFFEYLIVHTSLSFPQGARLKNRYPRATASIEWMSSSIRHHDIVASPQPKCRNPHIALLHVGRITRAKGHVFLIRMLSILCQEHPTVDFSLTCVGKSDQALHQELSAEAEHCGVADKIRWIPNVAHSDIHSFFDAADIFVFPSLWEGTPKVLLEAMARGLPIVASNVGGIPSVVEHEMTGLLVPSGSPQALAAAVWRMVTEQDLRQKCARNGIARASSRTVEAQTQLIVEAVARHYGKPLLKPTHGTAAASQSADENRKSAQAGSAALNAIFIALGLIIPLIMGEVLLRIFPLTRDSYQVRFRPDPDFRFHYLPNQNLKTLFGQQVTINSHGLRKTHDYSVERSPDTYRVLILGDSVGFGLNADDADIYTTMLINRAGLQAHFGKRLEIINGSCESYNTWNELAWYRKVGKHFLPDEVWWLYISNDFAEQPSTFAYIAPNGMTSDNPNSPLPLWFRYSLRNSALALAGHEALSARRATARRTLAPRSEDPHVIAASLQAFHALAAEISSNSALRIFYLANSDEARGKMISVPSRLIPDEAKTRGYMFFNVMAAISEVIHTGRDPYLPRDPIHLSPDGHSALARVIEQSYGVESAHATQEAHEGR